MGSFLFHLARGQETGFDQGFGMLKKKFGFLQHPFQMHDMAEIAQVVHCCFILHNMVVKEQVQACEDAMESANIHDCVEQEGNVVEEHPGWKYSYNGVHPGRR